MIQKLNKSTKKYENMKRLRRLFGLLGLSLIIATSQGNADKIQKPTKIISNLYEKTSNKFKTVCYKDEKSGVKDLEKSAKTSEYEKIFAFLPDSNKFVDIRDHAYNEQMGLATINTSTLDSNSFLELMIKENKIIEYHTHPKNISHVEIETEASWMLKSLCKEQPRVDKLEKKKKKQLYKIFCDELQEDYLSKKALPSLDDITTMIYETTLYSKLNPDGQINFRICSESGICTYNFTKKGIEFFNSSEGINCFSKWVNKKEKNKLYLELDLLETELERTRKFAAMLSDSFLTVDFKTYEEFYSPNNR